MPGQPSSYEERAAARRARLRGPAPPEPSAASSGGYFSGLFDAPSEIFTGARRQAKAQRGAIRQAGKGLFDIGSNLYEGIRPGGNADAALATLRGFGEGAQEGVGNVIDAPFRTAANILDPGIRSTYEAATAGGSSSKLRRIGAGGLVAAEALLPTKVGRRVLAAPIRGAVSAGEEVGSAVKRGLASRAATPKGNLASTSTTGFQGPLGNVGPVPASQFSVPAPEMPRYAGPGTTPGFGTTTSMYPPGEVGPLGGSMSTRKPPAWPPSVNITQTGPTTTPPVGKVSPTFVKTPLAQSVAQDTQFLSGKPYIQAAEEAGKRAGLTPEEFWSGRLSDVEPVVPPPPKVPPKTPPKPTPKTKAKVAKEAPPPKAQEQPYFLKKPETPPQVVETPKTAPKVKKVEQKPVTATQIAKEEAPVKTKASKQRPYAQMGDEAVSNKAAKGDANAVKELEIRRADFEAKFQARLKEAAKTKPVGKGPLARLKSETGSVGKDIEQKVIKKGEIEGEVKTGLPNEFSPDVRMTQEAGPGGGLSPRFRRMLSDETGAVNAAGMYKMGREGLGKSFDALNQMRVEAMLSGWALPKSILGNIGAHGVKSIENVAAGQGLKGLAPLAELPAYVRDTAKGTVKGMFQKGGGPSPAGYGGKVQLPGFMRPFSTAMSAGDTAATAGLQRSGSTLQDAQRLLLTDPRHDITKIRGNPIIDYIAPFKRTPGNQFFGGLENAWQHPGIAAGATGAGVVGGSVSDDPRALALMSSLGGPYALPFLFGAMATAGPRAIQGISPVPEWSIQKSLGDPANPFQEPAFTRMFEEPGQREKKTPRERAIERRESSRRRPTRPSR